MSEFQCGSPLLDLIRFLVLRCGDISKNCCVFYFLAGGVGGLPNRSGPTALLDPAVGI